MLCTCYLCGSYAAMRSYAAMQLKHSRFMFAWCFCKGDRGGEGGGDDGRGGFEPTVGVSGCRAPMMAWKPFYPQETLLCERLKTTGRAFYFIFESAWLRIAQNSNKSQEKWQREPHSGG